MGAPAGKSALQLILPDEVMEDLQDEADRLNDNPHEVHHWTRSSLARSFVIKGLIKKVPAKG